MSTNQNNSPAVSTENKPTKYVVVRGGHRVSNKEYDTPTDPLCLDEINFWSKISKTNSAGEKVEAVLYDSRRHRIW